MSLAAVITLTMHKQPTSDNGPRKARTAAQSRIATQCSSCNLREMCLPCGLTGNDLALMGEIVYTRRRVKRGETLYRAGGEFDAVFAVRSGFFKSSVVLEDGRDQSRASTWRAEARRRHRHRDPQWTWTALEDGESASSPTPASEGGLQPAAEG